ncbi:hypothetical protein HK097_008308 [Rhizophlyctis rosea]|uniref:Uncharacterized protein n=1 Tax=Rhizophlyctis rosea TaxID=64517 RepID=A0AAD5SD35_9FUNG|nr:hypothetical protein HK097_008308 [Rhizophlyctis rosea]
MDTDQQNDETFQREGRDSTASPPSTADDGRSESFEAPQTPQQTTEQSAAPSAETSSIPSPPNSSHGTDTEMNVLAQQDSFDYNALQAHRQEQSEGLIGEFNLMVPLRPEMTNDLMRMIEMYAHLMQVLLARRMEAADAEVDEVYTSIRTSEEQQVDALPAKLEACIKAIAELKDAEMCDLASSRSCPDVLISVTSCGSPFGNSAFTRSPKSYSQFPDVVIKNVLHWSSTFQPSSHRRYHDTLRLVTLSLVSTAWNRAVKSKLASDINSLSENDVPAVYLREMYKQTLSSSKRNPVKLQIYGKVYDDDEYDNIQMRLDGLAVPAMTVVEWIAHSAFLTELGLHNCDITGSVDLEEDYARIAGQHLKKCVSARICDNEEYTNLMALTTFVMQSFGSSLRSLELNQSLPRRTVPALDALEFLEYHHTENQIPSLVFRP